VIVAFSLFPAFDCINFHFSRAVLPVCRSVFFASLAYCLILAGPKTLCQFVKIFSALENLTPTRKEAP
jgi:hypothetical protein